jgi:hypothetical protein
MDQMTLQPVFHLFNAFLPSLTAFLVVSAVVSALPERAGKKAEHQPAHALNPMNFKLATNRVRVKHYPSVGAKMYTIPTSMRSRPRNY